MDSARAARLSKELEGKRVGGWEITGFLGAGKSAVVFRARNAGIQAALKLFDPELIERFGKALQLERIARELKLKGKSHPNLVSILDGGEAKDPDYLFVVMGLVEAPNLSQVLGDVPKERVAEIIAQVAKAAQFLETLELAHRDIKPENIAISPDFKHATLLDLGVLRPIKGSDITDGTDSRPFIGTLRYSSPEYLMREEEDSPDGWRALTFYQLGAVLHDLLTGERLFERFSEPYARLAQAVRSEIVQIERTDVPQWLVGLANNCLVKDPKVRLVLAKWEDFDHEGRRAPHVDAQYRVQLRRTAAQRASPTDTEVYRRELLNRRTLGNVVAILEGSIRKECIGKDLFPPLEIHDVESGDPLRARFVVRFAPSGEHSLRSNLSIDLNVALIDEQSMVVSVDAACAVSRVIASYDALRDLPHAVVYRGAATEGLLKETLPQLLYDVIDKAQTLGNPDALVQIVLGG